MCDSSVPATEFESGNVDGPNEFESMDTCLGLVSLCLTYHLLAAPQWTNHFLRPHRTQSRPGDHLVSDWQLI